MSDKTKADEVAIRAVKARGMKRPANRESDLGRKGSEAKRASKASVSLATVKL